MDARRLGFWTILFFAFSQASVFAATASTTNFIVNAPSEAVAKQIANEAERFRKELAIEWLGKEMPRWSERCPIRVKMGKHLGAGGATTFSFLNGEVFGWKMNVQGSLERILDSVIPHEITHTILACHFRRPLPRWADEGISTLIEHHSEKEKQIDLLLQATRENRRIPLRRLFAITEYPSQMRDVMTLYAEGFVLVDYLVQQGGKKKFLTFLDDALKNNWDSALKTHYKIGSVETLEKTWDEWIIAGRPQLQIPDNIKLVNNTTPPRPNTQIHRPGQRSISSAKATSTTPSKKDYIIRGQTPKLNNPVIPLAMNSNSATRPRQTRSRSEGLSYPIYRQKTSRTKNTLNSTDPFE